MTADYVFSIFIAACCLSPIGVWLLLKLLGVFCDE